MSSSKYSYTIKFECKKISAKENVRQNIWSKILCQKKNFGPKKNFIPKKILSTENFWEKTMFVKKNSRLMATDWNASAHAKI